MSDFEPTRWRFLPRDSADEGDVEDVEVYIRRTIERALPGVTDPDEIADLVNEGFLIVEETLPKADLGESFKRALSARLANRLRDYWRRQHPEYRRNSRAGTATMFLAPTGLAHEGAIGAAAAGLGGATDELAQVYDQVKVEELEGITSARELMSDPQKAGLLFGVASYRLTPARAEWAFDELQELRLLHRPQTRFGFKRDI